MGRHQYADELTCAGLPGVAAAFRFAAAASPSATAEASAAAGPKFASWHAATGLPGACAGLAARDATAGGRLAMTSFARAITCTHMAQCSTEHLVAAADY